MLSMCKNSDLLRPCEEYYQPLTLCRVRVGPRAVAVGPGLGPWPCMNPIHPQLIKFVPKYADLASI